MSEIFLKILNMSIAASWLVLVIIIIRPFLKKAPKRILCLLWAIVAVRLILPFSIESIFSLIPSSETIPPGIEFKQNPAINSGIAIINNAVNPVISENYAPVPYAGANPLQTALSIGTAVWITGVLIMLSFALLSYLHLKRKIAASVRLRDNIMICDFIESPFVFGIFKPMIYLPSTLSDSVADHVISHEKAHIKRLDHLKKLFGYLLLSVYWFNPLCLLSYVLLCRDIEMACDEEVIKNTDRDYIAAYSQTLLDCSTRKRIVTICPLSFGEIVVKQRVKGILTYKKPTFVVMLVAGIICAILSVCFLTNPQKPPINFSLIKIDRAITTDYRPEKGIIMKDLTIIEIHELHSRLKNLKIGRKDDDLEGFTPLFMIKAGSSDIREFSLIGYDDDAKIAGLLYNNSYYRIDDEEFIKYLSRICAKSFIDIAPEEETFVITKIDGEFAWADSYGKESNTDAIHNFKISIKDIISDSEPKVGDILAVKFRTEALNAYAPYTFVTRIGNIEEK